MSVEQRAALLDDTVDMLVVIDQDGMLTFANAAATALLGWRPTDEPISVLDVIHPDDQSEVVAALERFANERTPMRPTRLRVQGADSHWYWVEILSKNRLGVPGIDGVVVTARDVSEHVAAERRTFESEQRFRSLITASADPVLMMQPDGAITYASPEAEKLLANAGSATVVGAIHEDDVDAAEAAFAAASSGPVGSKHRFTSRVRGLDRWRWIESWIVNQIGVPGVDALVVYGRDVTAKHTAEASLRARVAADELVAKISARFVDVSADQIEAAVVESLAELGSFCRADRAWIFQLNADGRQIDYTHEWCAPGIPSEIDQLKGFPIEDLPGFADWIGDPSPLLIRSVDSMAPHLADERAVLQAQGIKSLAAQSMFVRGELYGLIGLDAVSEEVQWPDQVVWALDASASVFGAALRRCDAETALADNEARFRAMYDRATDGVRVLDADLRTIYASPAVERITGYSNSEIAEPGMRLLLVHPDDRDLVERVRDEVIFGSGSVVGTYRLRRPDSSWVHIEEATTNLLDDPVVRGIVVNMRDVSDRHAYEEVLISQARRDMLTGLPNRLLFEELLGAAVARGQLSSSRLAVIAVDLDRFRLVNDSLGHPIGDVVLKAAAERLRSVVRGGDVLARRGADEFVIVCEPVSSTELNALSDAIVYAFREPFNVEGRTVYITASIGTSISGPGDASVGGLVREADAALATAKGGGGDRAARFSGVLADTARVRLDLEAELRRALGTEQFRLHYQPIIDLQSGAVVGAEALLRWEHPVRGLLSPDAFLDVCEETGLIDPVGEWVIDEALRQLATWHAELHDALAIHLNVSVRQLRTGGVADRVSAALTDWGLDPGLVCVEITESALLAGEQAVNELAAVRALGVRIALDDFGTGHSSLAYLRHLAIDVLKIDRQFVDGVTAGGSDTAIVAAIVNLADSLGLEVVGEGIETSEQAAALTDLGCQQVQGYWYARPLPAERFAEFVAERGAIVPAPDPPPPTLRH